MGSHPWNQNVPLVRAPAKNYLAAKMSASGDAQKSGPVRPASPRIFPGLARPVPGCSTQTCSRMTNGLFLMPDRTSRTLATGAIQVSSLPHFMIISSSLHRDFTPGKILANHTHIARSLKLFVTAQKLLLSTKQIMFGPGAA